jgi:Tol biopolymer transport system component
MLSERCVPLVRVLVLFPILLSVSFPSISQEPASLEGLKGPYVGQEPPGDEPEVFAAGIVSTDGHIEMGITCSRDGTEIYFARSETSEIDSHFAIWVVQSKGGLWTKPEVASFSGVHRDFAPFLTPDGKYLLFFRESSKDAEVKRGTWFVERKGNSWGEARFLTDKYCVTTADFRTFYFTTDSERDTSRDIAMMIYTDGVFSVPRDLRGEINSDAYDAHSSISSDGSLMVFDSLRDGGFDRPDIYASVRNEDGSWSTGYNLGEKINRGHRHIASLAGDNKYLFFSSGGDIYWVDAGVLKMIGHSDPTK